MKGGLVNTCRLGKTDFDILQVQREDAEKCLKYFW